MSNQNSVSSERRGSDVGDDYRRSIDSNVDALRADDRYLDRNEHLLFHRLSRVVHVLLRRRTAVSYGKERGAL